MTDLSLWRWNYPKGKGYGEMPSGLMTLGYQLTTHLEPY
jgi:hypothetical protein